MSQKQSPAEPQTPPQVAAEAAPALVGLPAGALHVNALDIEAQGVARRDDGKVIFVEGALPGEWVTASTFRKKNNWEQATLMALHTTSSQRVTPACPHFGLHSGA